MTVLLSLFSILIFSFFKYKIKKFFIFISFFIFFSVSIIFLNSFQNDTYYERIVFETKRTLGISSGRSFFDSEHGAMFLTSYYMWKDNPFFGVGLKNYRVVCSDDKYGNIDSLVIQERCSTHPHNYYLELLAESGIIGFTLFILILLFFFKKNISQYLIHSNNYSLAIIITLFVIFWPLSFTFSLFTNYNCAFISFIVGLSLFFSKQEKHVRL